DSFRTSDYFYGGQLGARFAWEGQWFYLSGFGKVGFGATTQRVTINGATSLITAAGDVTTAQGGILALPTNSGTFRRTVVSVVPEAGLNIGVNVTSHLRLTAGYSFLMWTQVVRPGAQIDRNVNPAQIPTDISFGAPVTPAAPTFHFSQETFWLHSINLGLD